jgi:hypothetical protein
MRRLAIIATGCLALTGCYSTRSVRDTPAIREIFTSSKPAEQLAGCIGDAWADLDAGTKTNRTTKGWAVVTEVDTNIYGIADLIEQGKQTTVVYSGPIRNYSEKFHLPGVRACL